MSKLTEQWIELFRAGDYGAKGSFGERELDQMVRNFAPSVHEPPAVIGHPKDDLPAYGWVEALKRVGASLMGKLKQVEPQFEQMVDQGRFKKRSISVYETPNGPMLRHVGFLGAQPPVVKGLADVKFSDDKGTVIDEIIFGEEAQMAGEEKSLMDQLRAFFAGRESVTAPAVQAKTFSEDDLKKAVGDAVKPFADKVTELDGKLTQQAATFAEREQRLQLAEIGAAAATKIAQLKADGKWIPAFDVLGVPKLFSELAKSTVTIEFSEGDKKENRSLLDTAAGIFAALPKLVPPGTLVQPGQRSAATFSENQNSRLSADPNSVKLSEAAKARQKEKNITFSEALTQVTAEHPELAAPASISAGQV